MDGSDSTQSLIGKKFAVAKSGWFADAADLFVLLCSFLLTTASIVLVALIFHMRTIPGDPTPSESFSILQRAISALSITITSAVIMVAGRRYVLFKLARGGIRSRRVAVYSRSSIGNLAYYLVWNGIELPLLALSAVWALGLATGLTVNDTWAMVPVVLQLPVNVPFGPFDASVAPGSLLVPASAQLSYVMASLSSAVPGTFGFIQIIGGARLASWGPMGAVVYPPLPYYTPNSAFSLSTSLNGFNISMEPISSVPPTAQNQSLTCVNSTGSGFSTGQLWYEGGDNQTLSIIATIPSSQSLYRFNASAIILGGTLQSTGGTIEFVPNGITWPNVMPNDRWAQDIVSLVCNATLPLTLGGASSLLDFAATLNEEDGLLRELSPNSLTTAGIYWSTALGMAMGAYSSAAWPTIGHTVLNVTVTLNDFLEFTPHYGVYVLIANIVVSAIMLVVVVKLRMASHLGGDFINATRLLLDPLKNPELFNASLDTTVDALANPYMLVREDSEFLLAEEASSEASSEVQQTREVEN